MDDKYNPTYNLRDLIAKAHEEAVKIQSLFEMSTYDLTFYSCSMNTKTIC